MSSPPARPTVARMAGYTPGEQPRPGEAIIKLNTNENPYPPSPKVFEAIQRVTADALRRYPQPMADDFRGVAARVHGVSPEHVLAGNGSDDILQIALRSYCGPGDVLASPDPTYSLYPVLAELADVRFVTVAWGPDWSLPVEALLAVHPRAVFFANPNAPSGTWVAPEDISALAARTDALVLVDEAYVDFAGGDSLGLLARHENVLISRTLSKGYGLAGLRFGYALAHPSVIAQMAKVKDSYNCDAIAIAAASAALDDQPYAREQWARVIRDRALVTAELERRGFAVLPSRGNFVLATLPGGRHARPLYDAMKARGVLVRFFDKPGLNDKLRITIGSPVENAAMLAALDASLG
ncbi:MAG TPA: histidinol-phosphate transaminase [Vicinamibacterales bacterium]|nr:histidinol-phosphate transaminase [Vicinamibacterales bacterium]